MTPGFHFQNHTSFIDIFNEKSAECAREFERTIETHGDVEIDVNPFMAKCALNIICGNYKLVCIIVSLKITTCFATFQIKETAMGQQTRIEVEKAIYVNNVHRLVRLMIRKLMGKCFLQLN